VTGDIIVESWQGSDARIYEVEFATWTNLPQEQYFYFYKIVEVTIYGEYNSELIEDLIKIDKP